MRCPKESKSIKKQIHAEKNLKKPKMGYNRNYSLIMLIRIIYVPFTITVSTN